MKIGIIGAGNIGQALARLSVAHGHAATLSNSRGPDTLVGLAKQIGCDTATSEDAAQSSDVVVVTVPFTAVFKLAPHPFEGRVVIDTNNYYPDRDGHIPALDDRLTTTSEMVATHFRGASVVKAFNAILAIDLDQPVELGDGRVRALPIAGDDPASTSLVHALQSDFGYDTVNAGSLAESWRFDGPSRPIASRSTGRD